MRRDDPRAAWVAGLVVASAAYAVHVATHRGEILHGLADESLLVPLARKAADPSLYPTDKWLTITGTVFSHVYSWILATVLSVADDPVDAMRVLGFPFLVVFLAGSFRIVQAAAGSGTAWIAAAVLGALPGLFEVCWNAETRQPLGPGMALPRDLVFALVPWLWMAHEAARERSVAARCVVYAALGLLANLHPLTAAHLFLVFAIVDLLSGPPRRTVVPLLASGAAFAACALPYVIQYANFPRTPGDVPEELLRWRIGGVAGESPSEWTRRMEPALWFGAAAWLMTRGRRESTPRLLVRFGWIALLVAALAPGAQHLVDGIQLGRLTRVAVYASTLTIMALLPAAVRAWDCIAALLAAVCVIAALAGPPAVRRMTGADRGVLEYAARRIETRMRDRMNEGSAVELHPVVEARAREPSSTADRSAAFLEVCRFARSRSEPGDLFLVPPHEFGAFRAYAARGVVVTRKEGGAVFSFLGGRGLEWWREYSVLVSVIADWGTFAHRYGARWAVEDVGSGRPPLPDVWTEVFASGPYRVFRTDVR